MVHLAPKLVKLKKEFHSRQTPLLIGCNTSNKATIFIVDMISRKLSLS